jgi:hypothetical protein
MDILMNKEFFVDSKFADFFNTYFDVAYSLDFLEETKNSSLSKNCFSTINLLKFEQEEKFYEIVAELQAVCSEILISKLEYTYLHLVDYTNGGIMSPHSHDHAEDFSYILYLNTCDDGETVLEYKHTTKQVKPIKDKVLLFSSKIVHSSNYSNSKKVLVGGLKIKRESYGR